MRNLLVMALVAALSACGGGGSDTGGGGTPGPTPFAGSYTGTAKVTVGDAQGGASDTFPATLNISGNGQVTSELQGVDTSDTVCRAPTQPVFINGDQVPFNISGTCFTPATGNCTVNTTGTIVMSGNTGIGQSSGTISCESGLSFNIRYEVGFSRS